MRYIMTEFYVQNLNIQQTGSTQATGTTAVDNTSAPIELVNQKVVEGEGNIDVAQTNNTSKAQTTTKRTIDELYNSIAALCTQYGISLSEAKKYGLMEKIAGVPQEVLLSLPNSKIQKQVECLKAALEKLSANGEINLEELAKFGNNYNIAIHTGWSIKGFEKSNKNSSESLNERLIKFDGTLSQDFDITKLSKEEQVKILDKYFNQYFKELKQTKSNEYVAKLQLQDFGKLLINTPDEQKESFKIAFATLLSENRLPALSALLNSFKTQEASSAFADTIRTENFELAYREDYFGNRPTDEEMTGMSALVASRQTEQGRIASHADSIEKQRQFFEDNNEILERINNKLANNENLTPEEQEIWDKKNNFYTAIAAGEITGTANNTIISDEFKGVILNTINKDAYELPNYREVMEQVVSYVEKHPEIMTMPVEDFVKLMDEVTNGNYSIVVNDIKNGTTTALKEPAPVVTNTPAESTSNNTSSNTTNNISFGFDNTQSVDTTRLQQLTSQILTTQNTKEADPVEEVKLVNEETKTSVTDNITAAIKAGSNGFKAYIKNNGTKKAVVEVFNNLPYIANQGIIKQALRMYETFADGIQTETLKRVSNSGLSTLINHTSDSALLSMKGETFSNFYATKQVENAVEKVEEKKA